jgi:hypothetical protein
LLNPLRLLCSASIDLFKAADGLNIEASSERTIAVERFCLQELSYLVVRELLERAVVVEVVEELYRPVGWILDRLLVEGRCALSDRGTQSIGGTVIPSLLGDLAAFQPDR